MPVVAVLGVLGLICLIGSSENVERAKADARKKGQDNLNRMKKKTGDIPRDKYCQEAQDIFNSF